MKRGQGKRHRSRDPLIAILRNSTKTVNWKPQYIHKGHVGEKEIRYINKMKTIKNKISLKTNKRKIPDMTL